MSSSPTEPPADESTETRVTAVPSSPVPSPTDPSSTIGNLTVEDDPEGTIDPSDLAGTASDDDADVS